MGPAGPANWPGVCGAGRAQSPINLPLPDTKRRWSSGQDPNSIRYGELIFNYGRARAGFVSNPGHGSPQVCSERPQEVSKRTPALCTVHASGMMVKQLQCCSSHFDETERTPGNSLVTQLFSHPA